MGQKVRPTGFRTGIMRPWQSTWYANKQDFSELLVEDNQDPHVHPEVSDEQEATARNSGPRSPTSRSSGPASG